MLRRLVLSVFAFWCAASWNAQVNAQSGETPSPDMPAVFPKDGAELNEQEAKQHASWAMLVGINAARQGEHENAIAYFTKAIELSGEENPVAADVFLQRAASLRGLGRLDEALEDNNRAVDLRPDEHWSYGGRARTLRALGRYREALDDYDESLRLKPDDPYVHVGRGHVFEALGEFEQALKAYTDGIAADPNNRYAISNRAGLQSRLGNTEKAIADYTLEIKIERSADAYYGRGLNYLRRGDFNLAVEDYTQAIELDPNYHRAYFGRGSAHTGLGNYKESIEDYTLAISLRSDYTEAYINRGNVYRSLERFDEAFADYQRALELAPGNLNAYRNRGWAHELRGDLELARADYMRGLELNPDDGWLREAVSRLGKPSGG